MGVKNKLVLKSTGLGGDVDVNRRNACWHSKSLFSPIISFKRKDVGDSGGKVFSCAPYGVFPHTLYHRKLSYFKDFGVYIEPAVLSGVYIFLFLYSVYFEMATQGTATFSRAGLRGSEKRRSGETTQSK